MTTQAIQFDRSKMPAFSFNEVDHAYVMDGKRILSSTQILGAMGYSNYENVPENVLMRKRQLGKLVHQACHFHDENDLGPIEHEEVTLRLNAYIRFRQETGYQPLINEGQFVASWFGMNYGMQFDSIGWRNGRLWLVDIKNAAGMPQRSWGLQLASYALGCEKLCAVPAKNFVRVIVQLLNDGRYKLFSSEDQNSRIFKINDFQLWPACLAIALDRQAHGLLKEIP